MIPPSYFTSYKVLIFGCVVMVFNIMFYFGVCNGFEMS